MCADTCVQFGVIGWIGGWDEKFCCLQVCNEVLDSCMIYWGRTVRCVKSRLFSTTGSHGSQGPRFAPYSPCWCTRHLFFSSDACHGSQGPEFCSPCCFELIMHASVHVHRISLAMHFTN